MHVVPLFPDAATLFAGRRSEADFRALMWTKEPGLTHWRGGIRQQDSKTKEYIPKVGVFWTPNPVTAPKYATTYEGGAWKRGDGCFAGRDRIAELRCSFAEIDTGTKEEQEQRILGAIKAGMPVPTAVIHSGGKSYHLFWLLTANEMARHTPWFDVQCAMHRALGGDESIKTWERRMRYGCNRTNQAGPFGTGQEVRDQRVCYLGSPVALDELIAWAATVPLAAPLAGFVGVATKIGARSDWSLLPAPEGQGTLRDWAERIRVGEKRVIPCPFHDDSTASAFAKIGPSGVPYISCSAGCGTQRDHFTISADEVELVTSASLGGECASNVVVLHGADEDDDGPSPLREADGLVEVYDADARRTAGVGDTDRLLDGLGLEPFEVSKLMEKNPISLQTSNSEDDALEEGFARFADIGGEGVWCTRGPFEHSTSKGSDVVTSARIACRAYSCPVCGPRQVYALRAAAHVVVRRLALEGAWSGLRIAVPTEAREVKRFDQGLGRWVEQAPEARMYLTIAQTPTQLVCLVLWNGEVNAPSGVLRKVLAEGLAVPATELHVVADAMAEGVELTEWPREAGRAVILRGCRLLRGKVAHLRDDVLGRRHPKGKTAPAENPDVVSVVTYKSTEDVRVEMARRAMSDIADVGRPEVSWRRMSKTRSFKLKDGTPSFYIMKGMQQDGFFPSIKRGSVLVSRLRKSAVPDLLE